jgi:Flp pilus assembly protein CpaB
VKKKSPPYAIIGCVILGVVAVGFFLKHERDVDAQTQAAITAAQQAQAAQDAKDAANAKPNISVASTPTDVRDVFYATQPLKAGEKLSPSFYEKKLTPKSLLPNAVDTKQDITGWYAVHAIEVGDALTSYNIKPTPPFMSGRLTPGMRLVALPIFNAQDNYTGGYIVDGDKVDLLWTTDTQDGSAKLSTQFLLQNITVLSIPGIPGPLQTDKTEGTNLTPPPGDSPSVAFEVTPEQAQALIYLEGAKNGQFAMILRGRPDTGVLKLKPFSGYDYLPNLNKIQTMSDRSILRVQELQKEIEAIEKQGPGTTNETPTPPNP